MSFVVEDFVDLLRLLREHPEWKEELRREVLSEDLLRLPELVAENSRAIEALSLRTSENTRAIEALSLRTEENTRAITELRKSTEEFRIAAEARFDRMDERFTAVDERFTAVDARFDAVDARLDRIDERFSAVDARFDRLEGRLGRTQGMVYEAKVLSNPANVIPRLRRARVIGNAEIDDMAEQTGLDERDLVQIHAADLLLEGREGSGEEARPVRYAIEASYVIDLHDVDRVIERSALLGRLGVPTRAAVIGTSIVPEARDKATSNNVLIFFREDR